MDLRAYIDRLEEQQELNRISCEVDPHIELGAIVRKISDQGGPALLFENVKGYQIPVLVNIFGTRKRIADLFNVEEQQLLTHYSKLSNAKNYIPPILTSKEEAPCKEIRYIGNEVNLFSLPNPIWTEQDAGPYINFGVVRAKEPNGSFSNLSVNRLQVKERNKLGIRTDLGRDLGKIIHMYWQQGKACPVAITIGNSPYYLLASVDALPFGVDEILLAGALSGKPVLTTKCETSDIEIPIDSEIVIEGEIPPYVLEEEGPYGEFLGYVGSCEKLPIIEVKAITTRKNPIYLGSLEGMPVVEHHVMQSLHIENGLKLLGSITGVKIVDVAVQPYSGGMSAVISIQKRFDSDPKQLMMASFMISILKQVFIVDEDIDVHSDKDLQWAMATRFQPDKDITIINNAQGLQLDPSAYPSPGNETARISSKVGFDLTKPVNVKYPEVIKYSKETMDLIEKRWSEYGFPSSNNRSQWK
ncbi:UbiD family decarboxylase [Geobacillus sp. TFV-3]|uniref:UbiD family decarboxylase n=1 Tax=Geobacillus sp. TFV-3 TaxID=1897059 RepID=UPI001358801E|nr:UbiD family decarboxylase [Geobacillus sp. TFV-3]